MKDFLKYVLATVVGILLYSVVSSFIFLGIIGIIAAASGDKDVKIKENSILYLKLDKPIVDRASNNPFENFNFQTFQPDNELGLNKILKDIKKAKEDDKIKGIFMELSYTHAGIATIEEIRNSLIDFKQSGKFIYTYSDNISQTAYYLASVSNKIYLEPVGSIEIKGLYSKIAFFKGTLQKLGIEPFIFRHGKFKSAIEPFMLDKMSEANKEQTRTFVQSIWDYMVEGIAEQRNLTPAQVNKIADEFAIRNVNDAVEYNIIDGAKYRDEVIDELVEKTEAKSPEKLRLVKLSKYSKVKIHKKRKGKDVRKKIAVVYASGEIKMGKSEKGTLGSETIAKAIRKARCDSNIKAIVLRVNSPGGSGLASDIIWREVILAKKDKPVIVSMGDLAASGGYYISCPADVIVANKTTITGSIGVFGLLFNTQELMNKKLGVTFDGIKTNEFADLPDLTRPMTEQEKQIIQTNVNNFYKIFIGHVADGRDMTTDDVDKIGQGRVWSGVNAKDINLVDEFGGLNKAIEIAADKAGLEDYKIVDYPKQADPFEEMIKDLTGGVMMKFIKTELGDKYYFYQKIKTLQDMQGIQARMSYDVEMY